VGDGAFLRCEAVWSAWSAGDTVRHLEACLIALRIRAPTPTEELMIAPHTQELVRPKNGSYWVGPARGRHDDRRRGHEGGS
jgi:hypothetical protein